jgi:hypothetical protein
MILLFCFYAKKSCPCTDFWQILLVISSKKSAAIKPFQQFVLVGGGRTHRGEMKKAPDIPLCKRSFSFSYL